MPPACSMPPLFPPTACFPAQTAARGGARELEPATPLIAAPCRWYRALAPHPPERNVALTRCRPTAQSGRAKYQVFVSSSVRLRLASVRLRVLVWPPPLPLPLPAPVAAALLRALLPRVPGGWRVEIQLLLPKAALCARPPRAACSPSARVHARRILPGPGRILPDPTTQYRGARAHLSRSAEPPRPPPCCWLVPSRATHAAGLTAARRCIARVWLAAVHTLRRQARRWARGAVPRGLRS
ncbi:MAG: hypothetical protein J3K34DRAFT_435124 [Monoraphidium minutum]|nr:MAG: hypothetical protein J3K34DRAFT_435124 [Monoraphidium minutum]